MAIRQPDEYLWNPGNMLNSERVGDLSPLEELWYRRALDRAYDDKGISSDPAKAATRIGRECTVEAAEKILKIFFVPKPRDPSKMVNPRQEIARKKAVKSLKKFSDAGKESGRKRRERKKLDTERRLNDERTINKQINKDSSYEESKNTHTPHAGEEWAFPMKQLVEAFPDYMPDRITPAMIGFIEAAVLPGDEIAWRQTLIDYQMNFNPEQKRYLPDKTANLLGVFRKHKANQQKEQNDTSRKSSNGSKPTPADIIANRDYR